MPKPKTFDEYEVLKKAKILFLERGYEGTSIQALEDAMELKRPSIYNAFGNKRALFDLVLKQYMDTELSRFMQAIENASTCRQAIQGVLDEVIHLHFSESLPGGCLIVLSLLEIYQHDEETAATLRGALATLQKVLAQKFENAIVDGELPPHTEAKTKADEVVALITGMSVMAKANISKKRLEELASNSVSQIFDVPLSA